MSHKIAKLRKLAKAVAALIESGCAADEINPTVVPTLRWTPAEQLLNLPALVVNVAPASMVSTRLTRGAAERHYFVVIQVAGKITDADQVIFDEQVDALLNAVESIDAWLIHPDRAVIEDDALNKYSLKEIRVLDAFDWELLEEMRAFNGVLVCDYFHLQQ